MISTIKRKIVINEELNSKIKWACTFSNCEPKITNGNLRMDIYLLNYLCKNTRVH